jgi:hypothetical protein
MEKVYKNCQSCGMPLKKDAKGGGTNADGSKAPCTTAIALWTEILPNRILRRYKCRNLLKKN